MKAWLWRLLYPMNVWSRFVVYCGSLIKLYNKWIWVPFLDKLLSNNLKAVRDRGAYSTSHIWVFTPKSGHRVKLRSPIFRTVPGRFLPEQNEFFFGCRTSLYT